MEDVNNLMEEEVSVLLVVREVKPSALVKVKGKEKVWCLSILDGGLGCEKGVLSILDKSEAGETGYAKPEGNLGKRKGFG